eukprot:2828790-Pleurochrysis_carterae.AAC.4
MGAAMSHVRGRKRTNRGDDAQGSREQRAFDNEQNYNITEAKGKTPPARAPRQLEPTPPHVHEGALLARLQAQQAAMDGDIAATQYIKYAHRSA